MMHFTRKRIKHILWSIAHGQGTRFCIQSSRIQTHYDRICQRRSKIQINHLCKHPTGIYSWGSIPYDQGTGFCVQLPWVPTHYELCLHLSNAIQGPNQSPLVCRYPIGIYSWGSIPYGQGTGFCMQLSMGPNPLWPLFAFVKGDPRYKSITFVNTSWVA